ncbi:MAG TPA: hypothetical protein VFH73_28320 [Polyangia bacterium]|nr:hypothetical protein [Polyangia bacterium]
MSESAQLLTILRRVRRRLRGLAALQGAVVGALAAGLVAAAAVGWWRWRGDAIHPFVAPGALAVPLGLIAAGVLAFALRSVSLARCARTLDRSTDAHDRFLSALAFTTERQTAFTRAAIADAVALGRHVAPHTVAPLRRPRGLVGLGAAVVAIVVAAVVPVPSPARGNLAPTVARRTPEPPLRMAAADLEAERDEARLAEKAAAALDDAGLRELAGAFADALRDLTNGTVPRGEALDRLAELQKRAEVLAAEAEELGHALDRTAATMKESAITRSVGDAMGAKDPAATGKAVSELAERSAAAADAERNALAETLSEAAGRVEGTATSATAPAGERRPGAPQNQTSRQGQSQPNPDEQPQRRLARERSTSARLDERDAAAARSGERRLQRLRRELSEAAAACRDNPDSCRRKLRDSARELPRMENEASSQESRRRLSAAVRQLRERLRRDPTGNRDVSRQRAERQFTRAARGKGTPGTSKGEGSSVEPGTVMTEQGDPGDDVDIEVDSGGDEETVGATAGDESAAAATTAEGGEGQGEGNNGQDQTPGANGRGIGNQAGGDPLGKRDTQTTRGREREAPVKSGAGPTRAQVIEAAAARGFARGGYQGVFQDYQAVVEESLDASAVPPGRRYVVRRYFQLIRPRTISAPSRSTRSK